MKKLRPKNAHASHPMTWQDLARRLALHINWLHQIAPQTSASRARIARWRQLLGTTPATMEAGGAQRGGPR